MPARRVIAGVLTGLALVLAVTIPAQAVSSFLDVPVTHPYYAAITDLASRGIIEGYGDGNLGPTDPVSRQQFAKMIVKTLGLVVTGDEICPFKDVTKGSAGSPDPFYPDKYVAVCYEKGLIEPKTPTAFAPHDDLSRADLITVAARAADLPDPPVTYNPPFGDFSPDDYNWARRAAYAGLLDGLLGMGPDFDFFQTAAREECAQVLHNLLLKTQPESAETTSSQPETPPAAPGSADTGTTPGPTQGAATTGSPLEEERIALRPYMIIGICVGVLAALAAVLLLTRRARSPRRQSALLARSTSQSITGKDVRALLREWKAEAKASAAPPVVGAGPGGTEWWDDFVESAERAQAAEGLHAGEPDAGIDDPDKTPGQQDLG